LAAGVAGGTLGVIAGWCLLLFLFSGAYRLGFWVGLFWVGFLFWSLRFVQVAAGIVSWRRDKFF
jgi:hypothetical protein